MSTENPIFYNCELCDYVTKFSKDFKKHIITKKHENNKNNAETTPKSEKKSKKYNCQICDKIFNDRAGLWRHKKKCAENQNNNIEEQKEQDNLIMILIKQQNDLKNLLIQNQTMMLKILERDL